MHQLYTATSHIIPIRAYDKLAAMLKHKTFIHYKHYFFIISFHDSLRLFRAISSNWLLYFG